MENGKDNLFVVMKRIFNDLRVSKLFFSIFVHILFE